MSRTRTATAATGAPLGVYHGLIKKVEDGIESQFDNKMQIKVSAEILDIVTITDADFDEDDQEAIDELIGSEEWAWANDAWSPNTKAMRWAKGILGREIEKGEQVDLDEWEGREVQFTKSLNSAGNPAITDFAPWRKKGSRRAQSEANDEDAPRGRSAGSEDMMSPNQRKYIEALARDAGMDEAEVDFVAGERFGHPLDQLTKVEASSFISGLQELKEERLQETAEPF